MRSFKVDVGGHWAMSLSVAGALALFGCGTAAPEDPNGELTSQTQGLGEAACATVAADQTFSGSVNVVSPTTYGSSSCFKAYIVDLNNIPNNGDATFVGWANVPNDQATCEATVMWMQEYLKQGSSWVAHGSKQQVNGSWLGNSQFAFCAAPALTVPNSDGSSIRFAVSARLGGASGPTQQVELLTFTPGGPPR